MIKFKIKIRAQSDGTIRVTVYSVDMSDSNRELHHNGMLLFTQEEYDSWLLSFKELPEVIT